MSRRLRSLGIMGVVALVAMFVLLPVAGAAPLAAETKNVSIQDFKFEPKEISVNAGDTITWKNNGNTAHTVTADDGSFDSGNLDAGATFSHTFDKAGTFAYYCKFHGAKGGSGMAGSVAVASAAPTAPATAPAAAKDAVEAEDQPLKNGSITVAEVYASVDGWIAVHLDEGGKPGKVIGFAPVKAGETNNLVVKLDENVPVGGKVWPMLHIDAGTKGTYEFPGPDAPVIVNGDIIMKQIAITAAGGGPAGGQPAGLPRTGGQDAPFGLLIGALALLLAGGLLALRMRRHA